MKKKSLYYCDRAGCDKRDTHFARIGRIHPKWNILTVVYACDEHRDELEQEFGEISPIRTPSPTS